MKKFSPDLGLFTIPLYRKNSCFLIMRSYCKLFEIIALNLKMIVFQFKFSESTSFNCQSEDFVENRFNGRGH